MKMMLIPGYNSLFGKPTITYEELTKNVPSHIIISIFITLNNELNAPIDEGEIQKHLRNLISFRFSEKQLDSLKMAFFVFSRINPTYNNYVFGRRYLIALILKELNNFREFEIIDTSPEQEYNLLLAYFLVVDEVNDKDQLISEECNRRLKEENGIYRLLWTSTINQYEFNEQINIGFEYYKLLCFFQYCSKHLKKYLKEYLNGLGLSSIGQFIGSIHQVVKTTLDYQHDSVFKKLNFIQPLSGIDERHLIAQSINNEIAGKELQFSDIKKHPLFHTQKNGYLVIDEAAYNKKSYKSPFFELRSGTNLKDEKSFNKYSGDISLEVLEKICFRTILNTLQKSKHTFIHFDDTTDNVPDCYYRDNKTIFLIEFKAYLFPDELTSNPNFEDIKQYVDSRFIHNEKGHGKGITQLLNQIELLNENQFAFDTKYKNELHEKKITIYPVICHNEFYFSIPGINEYLNSVFLEKIAKINAPSFIIKPLVLINLETLFDLSLRVENFDKLETQFNRYFEIIKNRSMPAKMNSSIDNFLRSKASFDEIYQSIFLNELPKITSKNPLKQLIEASNISQDLIDEQI